MAAGPIVGINIDISKDRGTRKCEVEIPLAASSPDC